MPPAAARLRAGTIPRSLPAQPGVPGPAPGRDASPTQSQALDYIADLIYERCGIRLYEGKEAFIQARLGKLMRQHGFAGLAGYVEFLRRGADEEEVRRVVDALTTNFTHFLREPDHFEFLVRRALPAVLPPGGRRFKVWSAASSSGEETYTIAFYLAEHFPLAQGWNWSVTGSDISTRMLDKARLGIYAAERLSMVPRDWLRKYFQQGMRKWAGHYRVKPGLARNVAFRQINLVEDYAHPQPFEVIFCRNVMIYFDRPTQAELVARLCRFLAPQGYLFIGHSETLHGLRLPLRCLRPSIYQRS